MKSFTSKFAWLAIAMTMSAPAFAGYTCTVETAYGNYQAWSYDEGRALANARNQCIQYVHNGQICTYAAWHCDPDYYQPYPQPQPIPPPPPYPQPQPQPNPGWGQSSCQVTTQYGYYYGSGYNWQAALADARNQCIRRENNSYACNAAPFTCKK